MASSGVNSPVLERLWAGIHTIPPDTAVVPPTVADFSYTSTEAPWTAAVSAAVSPAPPLPSTTTSTSWSQSVTAVSLLCSWSTSSGQDRRQFVRRRHDGRSSAQHDVFAV